MRTVTRRETLRAISAVGAAMLLGCPTRAAGALPQRSRLGIVIYALGIHQRAAWSGRYRGVAPVLSLLEECHRFGAAGIQSPFDAQDAPNVLEFRRRAEKYEMYVEAILAPPRDQADVERFAGDVKVAKEAGATVARTVIIPGRRYERFRTLDEFRRFEARGLTSLELAEPILSRHRFRLAVENHKDQRIAERLEMLKRISSEFIGLCVDVANNFALMEDPLETARAFSPWALTVHIKDLAIRAYTEGFLLSDVALGAGFLDLPTLVKVLRTARPEVRFNLEVITRDPIQVPVLTPQYRATMPDISPEALARIMRFARAHRDPALLPIVDKLPLDQQLALEQRNVQQSLAYARERLGL